MDTTKATLALLALTVASFGLAMLSGLLAKLYWIAAVTGWDLI